MKNRSTVVLFLGRLFLGGVFAYAGFSKLMEPVENFRGVIAQYEVIPYVFVPVIAQFFPWLELFFGIFLIVGYLPRLSAAILTLFSLVFLIVLSSSQLLLGSVPVSCGCFGEGGIQLSIRQVFILDFFNMSIGFGLSRLKDHPFSLDPLLRKPR